jgi:ABC-type transport system involved in multi-copper enzyme maturation permease subunit
MTFLTDPNPILVKELRAITREPRFLVIHMLIVLAVSIVAVAMAAQAAQMYEAGVQGYDAARLGQQFYISMQIALGVAVVITVPGLAATTLTSEKDRKTFELMISCSTGPLQIIWGKFLATMVVVAVTIGSTLPFLAMAFFFGGVSITHVIGFSIILMIFAGLLASCVIYLSSMFESSTWATLSAYIAAFFIGLCFTGFLAAIGQIAEVRELYGIIYSGQERGGKGGVLGPVLAGWLVPVSISLWLMAYFFTSAAAMLDRLPVYRLGQPQQVFRWVQERGLAILAVIAIGSFFLACVGV